MTIKINNLPNHAKYFKYIVAYIENTQLWYWGAWDNEEEAKEASKEVNGLVIYND